MTVSGEAFEIAYKLGESSAKVYLTKDKKYVVKIYESNSRFDYSATFLSRLEYWRTRYLLEKGFPVARVYRYPETLPDGRIAVIKEYVEGLTKNDLVNADRLVTDADGVTLETMFDFEDSMDQKMADLSTLQARIGELYKNGNFIAWLKANTVDIQKEFFYLNFLASTMEVNKDGNYLYTKQGWVVIDP